jgi:ribonuclease HII
VRRDPETAELSLAELRACVAALESESGLRRWRRALANDPRSGARELSERCARRGRATAAERRRMHRLFARGRSLRASGIQRFAGIDEVGVGPLAGPVVAAAVVLREHVNLPGLDDSKQLSAATRQRLAAAIHTQAEAVGIAEVWPEEIDRLNIYRASLEAMRRAVLGLPATCTPQHLLVDARTVPGVDFPQTAIVHGDAEDASIAAASIVAKVHRDAIMSRLDRLYSGYGFARHMGYGTPAHLRALRELGPSPIHRRSFAPVAEAALRAAGGAPPPPR